MLPFEPADTPDLNGVPVLILAGRHDSMIPQTSTEALIEKLRSAGADLTVHWLDTGHGLTEDDLGLTAEWFRSNERPLNNSLPLT
jgi:predicted esterase